jgi:hypothetical protein
LPAGAAHGVEDLARSEGIGHDEKVTGEVDVAIWGGAACSGDEAGGSSHRRARITLDATSYLARHLSQGRNRRKHVVRVSVRV